MAPPARLDDAPGSHWNTLLEPAGQYSFNIWDRNVDSIAYYESYAGKYYTLDPVTPTHSVSVTGGAGHNCVLLANGQVGCWGYNAHGELGNGVTTSSSTPVATAGLIQGISLGAGNSHSCAVQYGGGVVCWGQNDQNQLGNGVSQYSAVPITVSGLVGNAATVGVGAFHSCAALVDGTVQCWGSNSAGQLGDGTQGNTRAAPVTVAGLPNDAATGGAIQVVGGAAHSCALLGDGTVRCWGLNDRGQLGNGASSNSTSPVIASGLTGVTSLSARGNATCAVLNNGTVWCWGDPTPYGVLGNSAVAPNYQRTPVQVTGITTARNVAVGAEHACASLQNNTATCWGRNDQGQLGNGTTNSSLSPVSVSGLTTVWAVGVGNSSSCALVDNHQTKCWGAGTNGELGNGANTASSTPVTVAPVPAWTACTGLSAAASPASTTATVGDSVTLTSVATGCATAEYEVYRRNADQTWTRLSSAYSPANSTFLWNTTGVTGGWQHLRVVARAPGSTQAFQAEFLLDYFLQSPDACNSLTVTSSPASTVGSVGSLVTFTNTSTGCLGTPEYSIRHRRPDGTWHDDAPYAAANSTWIWDTSFDVAGWNQFEIIVRSQNSTRTQEEVRYVDYYLQPGAPRLGGGFWQFCQLQGTGSVACWGLNSHGELGAGSSAFHSAIPLAVPGVSYGVSLGVGYAHACTSVLGGGVQCWGQNQWGQLGNGSQTDSNVAVNVAGITTALHVAAGTAHSCAALLDGTVKCWGLNTTGQLGNGAPNAFSAPVTVANLTGAKRVSAGYYHSCALLADGSVRCWGKNDQGQLGNGTTVDSLTPVTVSGLTNATQIATAGYENCAVKVDHTVWCWGANSPNGTLGDGTTTPHSAPVQVAGITNAVQVAVTGYHACAVLQDGTAKCWGRNDHGELGNGTTSSSLAPVAVTGLSGASTIAVSENASCAGLNNGAVSCWGWGLEGNLGNGSYGNSSTPVGVGPVTSGGSGSGGSAGSGGTAGTGGTAGAGGSSGGGGSCTPNCPSKVCGDAPDDGCGGTCTGYCNEGAVGCHTDADCVAGATCAGRTPNSTAPNVCVPPICLANPVAGGCGYEGAPCGPSCTSNPTCNSDVECPHGYVCGINAGYRYGLPGANVCEPVGCATEPQVVGCGTFTSPCGKCTCTPDCSTKHCGDADLDDGCGGRCTATCPDHDQAGCEFDTDCRPGSVCAMGAGGRVGLPEGANACMPARCFSGTLLPGDCGGTSAPCGICPAPKQGNGFACFGRVCGTDPVTGESCGQGCASGSFCTAAGQCAKRNLLDPISVRDPNGTLRPITPAPSPAPLNGFGATPGAFAVSERGSATYSIPIELPPGRAGVEPTLALRYSSSTPNGALGIGWGVDGFSAVELCKRSYSQDGYSKSLALDGTDAWCLDGQRLVPVDETTGEYRTTIDNFSKIWVSAQGGLASRFTVFAKDGRILEYGATADSRGASPDGAVRIWALNRVSDREGNFYSIRYRSTDRPDWITPTPAPQPPGMRAAAASELLPQSITYTGFAVGESPEQPGDREVEFIYGDTRPDKLFGFSPAGGLLTRSKRLERIRVRVGGADVKTYNLEYTIAPNNTSRLTSLRECARGGPEDGGACKAPTAFEYFDEQGFDTGTSIALPRDANGDRWNLPPVGFALGGSHDSLAVIQTAGTVGFDMPIPGWVELGASVIPVYGPIIAGMFEVFNAVYTSEGQFRFYRATWDPVANTVVAKGTCNNTQKAPFPHLIRSATTGQESFYDTCGDEPYKWFIDIDGDGVQDKLWCSNAQGVERINYALSQRAPNGEPPKDATIPDGSIVVPDDVGHASALCAGWDRDPLVLAFDFDGDGTSNLIYWRAGYQDQGLEWRALVYDSNGARWETLSRDSLYLSYHSLAVYPMDLNGDGLKDILALPDPKFYEQRTTGNYDKGAYAWINDGKRLRLTNLSPAASDNGLAPKYPAVVIDYDHDGIDELLQPNDASATKDHDVGPQPWILRRVRDGLIFAEPIAAETTGYVGSFGDFDGDGNVDLVTRAPKATSMTIHHGSGRREGLLKSAVDGLGRRVEVQYDNSNAEGLVYSNIAQDCYWPTGCMARIDHPVVSGHIESHYLNAARADTNVDARYSYNYTAARTDVTSGAWLGFDSRKIVMKDSAGKLIRQTDITNRTVSHSSPGNPWPAIYARVLDGHVSDVVETSAPIDFAYVPSGSIVKKRTHFDWIEQESTRGGLFATLRQQTTVVSGIHAYGDDTPGAGSAASKDFTRTTEIFQVDGFGNISDHTTVTEDLDLEDWDLSHTVPVALPGSTDYRQVHIDYIPDPEQLDAWLISLPHSIEEYHTPRCPAGRPDCESITKGRYSEIQYYPGSTREHFIYREPGGDPTAQRTTELVRNSYGNVEQVIETAPNATAHQSIIGYDDLGIFPVLITAGALSTELRYDQRFGKLTARIDANGIDETHSYDDFGILRASHGPGGDSAIEYAFANQHAGTFATPLYAAYRTIESVVGGEMRQTEYNALGQVVTTSSRGIGGAEVIREFYYDDRNRLRQESRPHLVNDTTQGYLTYTYDDWDRVVEVTGADQKKVLISRAFVPSLKTEYQQFVAHGALEYVEVTDPNGHSTILETDRDGRTVRQVDAMGHETTYRYAAFGSLEAITRSDGITLSYESDAYNRPVSSTDAAVGGTSTAEYNGFDQIVRAWDPLQRQSSYTYDALGRIRYLEHDSDGPTEWIYDGVGPNEKGRLVQTISPTGQRTTYGYEPGENGRNRGFLSSVTRSLSAPAMASTQPTRELTTKYHYDDAARLYQVDYPGTAGSGLSVAYGFDDYGHTVSITDAASPSTIYWQVLEPYQGYGVRREQLGNGTVREIEPDALTGALNEIVTRRGTTILQHLVYGHDDAGNMSSREDQVAGTYEGFEYDALDRLRFIRTQNQTVVREYTYEAVSGRRTDKGAYSYYADRGRDWVQSAGGTSYEPDSLGNIRRRTGSTIPGGSQFIDYTAFDLPSRIGNSPSDEGTVFAYAADRSRSVKRNADATVFYEGDLYQAVVQNGGAVQHRRMLYGPTGPIAAITQDETAASVGPRTVRYLHGDALGSVQTTTDALGSVVSSQTFEPFGSSVTGTSASQPYGFTGLEHDAELGLINMHGRMYDPALGQFLSPDPILSSPSGQGLNRFAYVDNNPLNFTDPSGFTPDDGPSVNGRAGFPLVDFARRHGSQIAQVGVGLGGAYALSQLGAGPTAIASSGGTAAAATGVGAGSSAIPASTAIAGAGHVMTAMIAIDHIINPGGLGSAPQPTVQPTRQSVSAGAAHPSIGQARGIQISPGQEGNSQLYYPPEPVPGDISPDEPIADAHVRREMARALADSHPSATPEKGSTEQGGWVLKRPGGGYDVMRWPTKGASYNGIPVPPRPPGRTVAASFHVHPGEGPDFPGDASNQDWDAFGYNDHPHYIVGSRGVFRLQNGVQSYLGPLRTGGSSALLWIGGSALVAGGGAAAYCHWHGC